MSSARAVHFDAGHFATKIGMPSNVIDNMNHASEKCNKHSYFFNSLTCLTCKDGVPICLQCLAISHNGHRVGSKDYYAIVTDDFSAKSVEDASQTKLEEFNVAACEMHDLDDGHISKKAKKKTSDTAVVEDQPNISLIATPNPTVKPSTATGKNALLPASESELQTMKNSCFVVFAYSDIEEPRIDQMMLGIGCVKRLGADNDSQFLLTFMMEPAKRDGEGEGGGNDDHHGGGGEGGVLDCLYVKQEMGGQQVVIDRGTVLGVNIKFNKGTPEEAAARGLPAPDEDTKYYALAEESRAKIRSTPLYQILYGVGCASK